MATKEELVKQLEEKRAALKKAQAELLEAQNKDWPAEAQLIMDKMDEEFQNGSKFLQDSKRLVCKDFHVTSPIGGIRNLWRVLTGRPGVVAAAKRRATNSPIQGFSSEIGAATAYLILLAFDKYRRKFKLPRRLFPKYLRAVHDANYYCVPYEMYLAAIHICQYIATYGISKWYKKFFNFKFLVEPEIEMDIGANDATGEAWDWALTGTSKARLAVIIFAAVKEQVNNKVATKDQVPSIIDKILDPWEDSEKREYLNKNYPLLGVPGLEEKQAACVAELRKLVDDYMKEG
jgi:hypothetical protein